MQVGKKIYCAHPISGCSYDEVITYYEGIKIALTLMDYDVHHPMCGKSYLRTELALKAQGYSDQPLSTNHAIVARDRWMCRQADILLINLVGAQRVSIGSMMELAWCMDTGKHVVLVMEKGNIHEHAFVLEAASVRFETQEEALAYLKSLSIMES